MSDRQRFNDITQRHLARLRSNLNDRSVDRIEADQSPLQVSPDVGGEQSDQLLVVEARGHELLSCDLWKFQYNIVQGAFFNCSSLIFRTKMKNDGQPIRDSVP